MTSWLLATADPADGGEPVRTPVQVVRLSDGRLAFATRWSGETAQRVARGAVVTLEPPSGPADRVVGTATVVRSGRWYDEARGRLRTDGPLLERLRTRRADAVVLVGPVAQREG